MARCGCGGSSCSCKVIAGTGIKVTGNGSALQPFVVEALSSSITSLLEVDNTATINMTLLGSGTTADPYVLRATADLDLADLTNVTNTAPVSGQILGYNGTTGQWGPINPPAGGGGGGTGSVNSVNNQTPDLSGNVQLTAGDVGARATSAQVPWADISGKPATFAPDTHTHTAAQISDATALGRSVLTAASAAAARTAIGATTPWEFGVLPVAYWSGSAWPSRASVLPSGYTGRILWDSAEDDDAPAPTGHVAGDRWFKSGGLG